jgi:large subunit ribosomal protein L22
VLEAKAVARYVRIAPRKVRPVVDLIRGKSVEEALAVLRFTPDRAARVVAKVVQSAAANAEHNLELPRDSLRVARAYVDHGPTMRRLQPRARGRADIIRRRSSHITVIVAGEE